MKDILRRYRLGMTMALAALHAAYPTPCHGQVFEKLHTFTKANEKTDNGDIFEGSGPAAALVQDNEGNFYGTTVFGGGGFPRDYTDQGTVFRITPAGQVKTLVTFNEEDFPNRGLFPMAALLRDSGGNLYGTTSEGGANDHGTLFRISPAGTFTTVVNFTGNGSARKGSRPNAALVQGSLGKFYGTTSEGGTNGHGTVFNVTSSGTVTTLVNFTGTGSGERGSRPNAALLRVGDTTFYGTTSAGGTSENGTIFRVTSTGTFTSLVSFSGNGTSNKGRRPNAALISDGNGNFLGTTSEGGLHGHGTVFRVTPTGTLTTLMNFTGNGASDKGSRPNAALVLAGDGNFYGTTSEGGAAKWGTVFRITAAGELTTLVEFAAPDGRPNAPLIAAADGSLYGTTSGPHGTVYRLIFPGKPHFIALTPSAVDANNASLHTRVNAAGATATVFLEFGTDGINFPNLINLEGEVSGDVSEIFGAVLRNLQANTTYHYRFGATNSAGTSVSDVQTFKTLASNSTASVLNQVFPEAPPESQGSVTVTLSAPPGVGGWHFEGEPFWRQSGVTVGGLPGGDRTIRFRPAPGHIHPQPETVSVVGGGNISIVREYSETSASGGGSLAVTLKPDDIAATNHPVADRAQWRLLGEDDSQWRNSGGGMAGLLAGTYLIECKPVAGRVTPGPGTVTIAENEAAALTLTYFIAETASGSAPAPVPYADIAADATKPFAFVGQIRSDSTVGSGFAVMPRVVATASHIVFDDSTLSAVTGAQWLFRRHSGDHEPMPRTPRASFILDDYASKRASENTPGRFSPVTQNSDAAVMYFDDDIAPDVASGYLASDAVDNEFLLSSAKKTLVGYPVGGIPQGNIGRMHATPPANVTFTRSYGYTYTSDGIRGGKGMAGGPLCVQHPDAGGSPRYFPAAIYLGTGDRMTVRAFDFRMFQLIGWADRDSSGGSGPTTPGATLVSLTGNLNTTEPGSLRVILEPAAARDAGAGWLLSPETTFRQSDTQIAGLAPGNYELKFRTISGFLPPPPQTASINGGQLTTFTYTYQAITPLETWRFDNFGTYENTGDAADENDFDKDGKTNREEFIAGTNPKDGSDFFKMATTEKSGNTFTATCAGKAGRTYTLLRSTGLTGEWTRLGSQGPLAGDATVTLSDTAAPPDKSFYRIEVTFP